MLGGTPQLTQILLFRRNLERVAQDEEELRDEIRTTLLHETGHFFGMTEKDLDDVGARGRAATADALTRFRLARAGYQIWKMSGRLAAVSSASFSCFWVWARRASSSWMLA